MTDIGPLKPNSEHIHASDKYILSFISVRSFTGHNRVNERKLEIFLFQKTVRKQFYFCLISTAWHSLVPSLAPVPGSLNIVQDFSSLDLINWLLLLLVFDRIAFLKWFSLIKLLLMKWKLRRKCEHSNFSKENENIECRIEDLFLWAITQCSMAASIFWWKGWMIN